MPARRRFEATPETVLRDLAATLARMGATDPQVALGGRMSKELARLYSRSGIGTDQLVMDLVPAGAAVAFTRAGKRYRFACAKYDDQRDNLRAAQLAVTLLYRVYDEYAVTEGKEGQAEWDRLFGGHLTLGDGSAGEQWHEVLRVAPNAGMAVVRASYHALAKTLHPDRTGDDGVAMARLNRAYEQARDALGVG